MGRLTTNTGGNGNFFLTFDDLKDILEWGHRIVRDQLVVYGYCSQDGGLKRLNRTAEGSLKIFSINHSHRV